ncbi:hypothetical protein ACQ86E_30570 [Bradyrhizobium betae]|uniref:hypothetical protein n=1 Tax=Bradyrhizobium betae TaxID=244734 RepID=UPI003D67CE77
MNERMADRLSRSIDRQCLLERLLLVASPRPRLNGEGKLMLTRGHVRDGRLRHLDALRDRTGVNDPCVDRQKNIAITATADAIAILVHSVRIGVLIERASPGA